MNKDKKIKRLLKNITVKEDCWIYNSKTPYSKNRIFYTLFVGDIPKGMCVCHSCDNSFCVNPSHLWLGSYLDNAKDRDIKGRNGLTGKRRKREWNIKTSKTLKGHNVSLETRLKISGKVKGLMQGEQNPYSKLTSENVIFIREYWDKQDKSK